MIEAVTLERLTAQRASEIKPALITILQNIVDNGSSVGFLRPLSVDLADKYWTSVIDDLSSQRKILLVARQGNYSVGTVQLELCSKQNGQHRAEVQKLMVLTTHRKHGIARMLMNRIEQEAYRVGRTLLFLDTVTGKPAEQVYVQLGWTRSGTIPNYAISPDGEMESTTIFYKLLDRSAQLAA